MVGKLCRGTVTAIKSEVTSVRSKAEAVGTWWRVFIRPDSPRIKSGVGQSAQGAPETQLGARKHPDTQTTPRPMKSLASMIGPGIRICWNSLRWFRCMARGENPISRSGPPSSWHEWVLILVIHQKGQIHSIDPLLHRDRENPGIPNQGRSWLGFVYESPAPEIQSWC